MVKKSILGYLKQPYPKGIAEKILVIFEKFSFFN